MKHFISCLLILIFISCGSAKKHNKHIEKELSVKEMKEDLEFVKHKLFKMHPDVDLYISTEQLAHKFDSVSKSITHPLKPNDFFFKIAPILASVKQGHMQLYTLNPKFTNTQKDYKKSISPFAQFKFLWKDENLYVLKNNSKNKSIKEGDVILDINGITPKELYIKYRPTFTSDGFNETFIPKSFERKINGYYSTELGILDSITIKLKCEDSLKTEVVYRNFKKVNKLKTINDSAKLNTLKIQLSKQVKKRLNDSLKLVEKQKRIFGYSTANKDYIIKLSYPEKDSSLAVLKINSFSETKYKKAYKLIFNELNNKNIQNLVLDLRGNTGGRINEIDELYSYLSNEDQYVFLNPTVVTSKWKLPFYFFNQRSVPHYIIFSPFYVLQIPFTILNTKKKSEKYFFKLPQENKHQRKQNYFKNNLYVLIDGQSFSASSLISSNLKGTHRGLFVGNETGGTYNGTVAGRLPILTLPKSKLKWRLGVMHIIPKEQTKEFGHGIKPDITIIPTVEQILNNEDPEMEWIINKIQSN